MLARIEEASHSPLGRSYSTCLDVVCVSPCCFSASLYLALTHSLCHPTQFQTVATTENEPADRKGDGRQLGVIRICQRAERARWYLPDRNNVSI
jgi:hypothetical protein